MEITVHSVLQLWLALVVSSLWKWGVWGRGLKLDMGLACLFIVKPACH